MSIAATLRARSDPDSWCPRTCWAAGRRAQLAQTGQHVESGLDARGIDAHAGREGALALDIQLVGRARVLGAEPCLVAGNLDRPLSVRRVIGQRWAAR